MTIKTTTFGHVELSGKEAARFIRHMEEDKPNKAAQASLARGREVLRQLSNSSKFPLQPSKLEKETAT